MAHELAGRQDAATKGYEPPAIETVLTPEGLEREVQYAGLPSQPPSIPG